MPQPRVVDLVTQIERESPERPGCRVGNEVRPEDTFVDQEPAYVVPQDWVRGLPADCYYPREEQERDRLREKLS